MAKKKRSQPSVRQYREALVAIDTQLNVGDRQALATHAAVPKRDLSDEDLAAAAGQGSPKWTHLEYGRVGHLLADELGLRYDELGHVWTRSIGDVYRLGEANTVHWTMHRNPAMAIPKMPWGQKSKVPPTKSIRPEHVFAALTDLDRGVEHRFHESTKFDLVHHGRRYPPKAVYGLAAKHATGWIWDPRTSLPELNRHVFGP